MARRDPRHIFAAVKTILVLAHPYDSGHPDDFSMVPPAMGAGNNHRNAHVVRPLSAFTAVPSGRVARYARGVDYHLLLKKKLAALQVWLRAQGVESRVITDSAPLFEKPMAQLAGLGWRGKHTNLVSRHLGNWFLLAEVMLSVDLLPSHSAPSADSAPPAAPAAISPPAAPTSLTTIMPITRAADIDHCGSCQACLQSCPTNAFPAPYVLDARRCISYLTIEHHGIIDRAYRRAMGDMIFGCDICLAVCPFNKFAAAARGMKIDEQLQGSGRIDLITILTMTTDHFAARFRQSPIKRLGLKRLQRNALIALGNYFYDHVKNMAPDDSKEKWHKQEKQRLV
ncbi:MAG: DUF1730 domain-containing protein, partial [Alphaproteobacteria bacterium]|nr:DUF1730 domain-containing protein [Alphaproteobacteria bacterium]